MSDFTPYGAGEVRYPDSPYQSDYNELAPYAPPVPQPGAVTSPYVDIYQEQPLEDAARYTLYDRTYNQMEVSQWQNTPRDDSEGSLFWRTGECFTAEAFLSSSRARKENNFPAGTLGFFVIVVLGLIMLGAAVGRATALYGADVVNQVSLGGWRIVSIGLLIGVVCLVLFLVLMFYAPHLFMTTGIYFACFVSIIGLFVSMYYFGNVLGPLWMVWALAIVGFICNLVVNESAELGEVMLGMVESCLKSRHFLELFISMLFVVILMGLMWGFSVFYGILCQWNGFYSAFAVVVYWYCVSVLGQMTYQMGAQLTAYKFFLEGCLGVEYTRGDIVARMWQNLGISCVNAFFIPVLYPVYALAKMNPDECQALARKYCDEEFAANFVGSVCGVLHRLALQLAMSADSTLGYPSEEGSVYSAMFGVTRLEGCRRFAEIRSKNYVDLMHQRCKIDYLLGFVMLVIEITAAILVWDSSSVVGTLYGLILPTINRSKRLGGAVGFFAVFGCFQITKQLIKAITDTTIICFYEVPQRLQSVYGKLDEPLRDAYSKAQLGARGVGRSEEVPECTALGQSLFSEQGNAHAPLSEEFYASVPSYAVDQPPPTFSADSPQLNPPANTYQ